MTTAAQPFDDVNTSVRTIVSGGIALGIITALGVTAFALVSRPLDGTVERIVQILLVLAGGAVFSYVPAHFVRPREVDSIAWASLLGLLGALSFTVIDTAILRPLNLYHWTWDAIGGGSGFWYVPVWWMGSAFLAWLGCLVHAIRAKGGPVNLPATAGQTVGVAVVLLVVLVITGIGSFHAAFMGLSWALALVVHVMLAAMMNRQ